MEMKRSEAFSNVKPAFITVHVQIVIGPIIHKATSWPSSHQNAISNYNETRKFIFARGIHCSKNMQLAKAVKIRKYLKWNWDKSEEESVCLFTFFGFNNKQGNPNLSIQKVVRRDTPSGPPKTKSKTLTAGHKRGRESEESGTKIGEETEKLQNKKTLRTKIRGGQKLHQEP